MQSRILTLEVLWSPAHTSNARVGTERALWPRLSSGAALKLGVGLLVDWIVFGQILRFFTLELRPRVAELRRHGDSDKARMAEVDALLKRTLLVVNRSLARRNDAGNVPSLCFVNVSFVPSQKRS